MQLKERTNKDKEEKEKIKRSWSKWTIGYIYIANCFIKWVWICFQVVVGEGSTLREAQGTCEERDIQEQQQMPHHVTHEQHQQYQQQVVHHHHPHHHPIATSAFHVSRPSHPISTIMSPPNPLVHHTSIILDHEDAFHVSRLMLQNDNFQVTKQPLMVSFFCEIG